MFGRGIDHDIRAQFQRVLKHRRGKDIVHDHQRAHRMGNLGDAGDINDFQRRVRDRFEKHHLGVRAHRAAHCVQVGAVDKRDLDPVAGQHLFEDIEAGPEERARRHHMIARAQHRHVSAPD
jgi:hypothetical protein